MTAGASMPDQGHAYFEHGADIGIIGRGGSIEASFVSAARAMFAIQTELDAIESRERIDIAFDEADAELALVTWLNALLAVSRARGMALRDFSLERAGERWRGWAGGEPWRDDLVRGTEVKGATLTMLSVTQVGESWEARCVVDL